MVYQYPDCFPVINDVTAEIFEPVYPVEVEKEDDVGIVHRTDGPFVLLFGDDDVPDTRHPGEESGIFVWNEALYVMAERTEHFGPRERRTDGVSVRIGMRRMAMCFGVSVMYPFSISIFCSKSFIHKQFSAFLSRFFLVADRRSYEFYPK